MANGVHSEVLRTHGKYFTGYCKVALHRQVQLAELYS